MVIVTFRTLQERLRQFLLARIRAKQLSGVQLAQQTGFQQAHISNFLNRKRGLSLQGLDRVLAVQHLSALDLLHPDELSRRPPLLADGDEAFESAPLVDGAVAASESIIAGSQVRDVLKFKKSFLRRLRPEMATLRHSWRRFVLIKMDAREGMGMYPRATSGVTLLIDRHYNSLKPYRRGQRNIYAVRKNDVCTIRYIELSGNTLVLRPYNPAYPVDVLPIDPDKIASDYIVGRVCHVAIET